MQLSIQKHKPKVICLFISNTTVISACTVLKTSSLAGKKHFSFFPFPPQKSPKSRRPIQLPDFSKRLQKPFFRQNRIRFFHCRGGEEGGKKEGEEKKSIQWPSLDRSLVMPSACLCMKYETRFFYFPLFLLILDLQNLALGQHLL